MKKLFPILSLIALSTVYSCSSSDDLSIVGFNNPQRLVSTLETDNLCKKYPKDGYTPDKIIDVSSARARVDIIEDTVALESYDIKYGDGGYLSIDHKNCHSSCGTHFIMESFIDEDSKTIIVNEMDISEAHSYCSCEYDLKHIVGSIKEGDYRLVVTSSAKSLASDKDFDINKTRYIQLDIKIHFDKNLHIMLEERYDKSLEGSNYRLQKVDEFLGYILERRNIDR